MVLLWAISGKLAGQLGEVFGEDGRRTEGIDEGISGELPGRLLQLAEAWCGATKAALRIRSDAGARCGQEIEDMLFVRLERRL